MTTREEPEILYGVKAIAEWLGTPEKATRHRIEAGIIPTFKMPGAATVCARPESLRRWLREQEEVSERARRAETTR